MALLAGPAAATVTAAALLVAMTGMMVAAGTTSALPATSRIPSVDDMPTHDYKCFETARETASVMQWPRGAYKNFALLSFGIMGAP